MSSTERGTNLENKLTQLGPVTIHRYGTPKEWDETFLLTCSPPEKVLKCPSFETAKGLAKVLLNYWIGSYEPPLRLNEIMLKSLTLLNVMDGKKIVFLVESLEGKAENTLPTKQGAVTKQTLAWIEASGYFQSVQVEAIIPTSHAPIEDSEGSDTPDVHDEPIITPEDLITITTNEVYSIYSLIWDWIDEGNDTHKLSLAYNYLAFSYLILSRIVAKSPESISRYIPKNLSRNFNAIVGAEIEQTSAPPHSKILKMASTAFIKGTASPRLYLSQILRLRALYKDDDSGIAALFDAGCLTHLKFNGMGLINVSAYICHKYRITVNQLIMSSAYECYEQSLLNLIKGLTKLKEEEKYPNWAWCRLLNDKFEMDLNSESNKFLLELYINLISKDPENEGIWLLQPWGAKPKLHKWIEEWATKFELMHTPKRPTKLLAGAITIDPEDDPLDRAATPPGDWEDV